VWKEAERQPVSEDASVIDRTIFEAQFDLRIHRPVALPFVHAVALVQQDVFGRVSWDPWYRGTGFREETDFYLSAAGHGFLNVFDSEALAFHVRGGVSGRGGQRGNRLLFEFWAIVNTTYMFAKHWPTIAAHTDLGSTPLEAAIRYAIAREARMVGKIRQKVRPLPS